MMSLSELTESKGYKNFMKYVYGWGASVVLIGALFKIMHFPGASIMLTLGLSIEALIFFFSAFEPLHEELDWTLVYPELAGLSDEFDDDDNIRKFDRANDMPQVIGVPVGGGAVSGAEAAVGGQVVQGGGGQVVMGGGSPSALAKFDQMLDNAEIGPEIFEKLGAGLNNLSDTAAKLNDLSAAGVATKDFVSKMQGATNSVEQLDETYKKSSEVLKESVNSLSESYVNTAESFNNTNQQLSESYSSFANKLTNEIDSIGIDGAAYAEKLGSLNSNLSALNSVYELQIQNTNNYVESAKSHLEGLNSMAGNMSQTADNAAKLDEDIVTLKQNVASLNTIYGSMLSSLNSNK